MNLFQLEKANEATAAMPFVVPHSENMTDFPHYHRELEVIRCERGRLKITADSGTFSLEKGEIVFFMPYEIHNIVSEKGSVAVVMKIYQEKRDGFSLENLKFGTQVINPGHGVYNRINPVIDRIKKENTERKFGYEIATAAAANELLLSLVRGASFEKISKAASDTKLKNIAVLGKVNDYLKENYANPVNLESAAKYCNMSKFYFSHSFKEITGMGFCEYLNAYRVKKAAELMEKTDFSQMEIAYEVGFNNYQSYLRAFKKIYGITPKKADPRL